MNRYLISISVGPVQEFIAAARRTADLKQGSQLLQDLAGHIATELEQRGGTLIFPATSSMPGPNKVVAEVPTDDPSTLVEDLRSSAVEWLWQKWISTCEQLHVPLDADLAEEQVRQFLEFYAAWVPYSGSDYPDRRQRVELLLAGRKALRNFQQIPPRPGRWKSPLDPSRDTVLELQGSRLPPGAEDAPLSLKPREYLDAISLLKRVLGSSARGAPSTSEMAAQSALCVARRKNADAVDALEQIAQNAPGMVDIGDLMFPTRVQEEIDSGGERLNRYLKQRQQEIDRLRKEILRSVQPPLSECPPYYALVAADGDRMGALIAQQNTPNDHRQLSQRLADFARQARNTVQQHHGYTIYAGGDDLLAMLPINTAIACAVQLADAFRNQVGGATLSIGIAIVHHLENLHQALEWARQAEREAKVSRNALAVALHTRGGVPISAVTVFASDPYQEAWMRSVQAFREGLSHGFPYELVHLAREAENTSLSVHALRAEAMRIYRRKEGSEARGIRPEVARYIEQELQQVNSPADLRRFAERLIIARFLATVPDAEVTP